MLLEALEERIGSVDRLQIGTTILARVGFFNLTAKGVRDELCTIADTQNWHLAYKLAQVYLESLRIVDAIGRAAQNDTYHGIVAHRKLVVGHNLAEGIELAHPTANELGGLRTKI